ncbi:MAG: hypothetical protein KME07_03355 [Pegethrix bostrychoides GSE-TBD4-15B]|jgi:hypothetical protein|uniref:Uncharacterized protein n=1 Tax=Pegethrix bostrychoides GSE-TBD4-15B TaxID=2839662 RepID=A0A951U4H5_9CYAN|nr:hypothetical protein [Pegethrix bostrychoides GSE-TBD4-15B]
MNSLKNLVDQGMADLQQGDLEMALSCFVQALRQNSGSVYVAVSPVGAMNLSCQDITQEITILISLNKLDSGFNSQSAVYIQDGLTTQIVPLDSP